jgi:lysophospholipid acyltransferase (LPLAT)-like uncharacterized protein
MKLRNPRLIRLASWLTAAVLRPWVATLRGEVDHGPGGPHPSDPARQRYVYVLWHEALLAAFLFRRYPGHVLISQHADGELIAQACERLGVAVIRGSSRKGGARALLQMCRLSDQSHIVITPDGPRGPRRRMPEGVIQLAGLVGLPILPVGIGFQSAWRANSWDRFAVPRPFSTIHFHAGAPIVVPQQLDDQVIESYRQEAEAALLAATDRAERSAAGNQPSETTQQPNSAGTGSSERSGSAPGGSAPGSSGPARAIPQPHRRTAANTSSLTAG